MKKYLPPSINFWWILKLFKLWY